VLGIIDFHARVIRVVRERQRRVRIGHQVVGGNEAVHPPAIRLAGDDEVMSDQVESNNHLQFRARTLWLSAHYDLK
jgi:hypothetical protein